MKRRLNKSNYKELSSPSAVEDKSRTFPHWTVYIGWICKYNLIK